MSGKAERSTIFDLGQGCVLASRNGRCQWLKKSTARLGAQTHQGATSAPEFSDTAEGAASMNALTLDPISRRIAP
jgi:hypothetical protein